MSESPDETPSRARRERSARYPGAPLPEAIELVRFIDDHGLDGTSAESIAASMGFESIKTRTFSARLSAARQFGLLTLDDSGYRLSPIARNLLHPVDPDDLPRLHREALKTPPLYADLLVRLCDRRVPEPERLANLLYHSYQITASAKLPASESFVESARFAGVLGMDGVLRRTVSRTLDASRPRPRLQQSPRCRPRPRQHPCRPLGRWWILGPRRIRPRCWEFVSIFGSGGPTRGRWCASGLPNRSRQRASNAWLRPSGSIFRSNTARPLPVTTDWGICADQYGLIVVEVLNLRWACLACRVSGLQSKPRPV